MLRYLFNIANVVTIIGFVFGGVSIIFSSQSEWGIAILFMLLAVVCDVYDGILARKFNKNNKNKYDSEIGKNLDSLADICHSSIAPALFIYFFIDNIFLSLVGLIFILISGIVRLSYFNVFGMKTGNTFRGLPIFYSPMLLAIAFLSNISFLIYLFPFVVSILHVLESIHIKKITHGISFIIFNIILFLEIFLIIMY